MCTAISVNAEDNYFGRNLDFETDFGERVTITPRRYPFEFTNGSKAETHHAIIGMALVNNDYPLYFDATNEKGLSVAGLRFSDNAVYNKKNHNKDNVASYEFIPYILSLCENLNEARRLVDNINITDDPFDNELKPSALHWLVADKTGAITVEQTKDGMKVFENPVGVLTNNPPFDIQMFNLCNYMSLSPSEPKNTFSNNLNLTQYSRGMGAMGLPGDLSSMSRFVKASFLCENSVFEGAEEERVDHFFKILFSVCQIRGTVKVGDEHEITHYTSCCNTDKGIYYFKRYGILETEKVVLDKVNLNDTALVIF